MRKSSKTPKKPDSVATPAAVPKLVISSSASLSLSHDIVNPTPSVSVSRSVSNVTGLYPTRDCPSSVTQGVTGLYPHGDCPSSAAPSVTGYCPFRDCPSSATRGVTGLCPHGDCPSSAAAGYGTRLPGPGLEPDFCSAAYECFVRFVRFIYELFRIT